MIPYEKFKDVIMAGALGDAFGYQVEFLSNEEIKIKFPRGLNYSDHPGNVISDDTQMTIFMLNSILESSSLNLPDNLEYLSNIKVNLLDWYCTQINQKIGSDLNKYSVLFQRRAPGNTCIAALSALDNGEIVENDSMGCGTIMRTAPLIILKINDEALYDLSFSAAEITHHHQDGNHVTAIYTLILRSLALGNSFKDSLDMAINLAKNKNCNSNILAGINKALSLADDLRGNSLTKELGEGWDAPSCLYLALYAFKNGKDFTEVLNIAAIHSGDSDSVASIAGQLYASQNRLSSDEVYKFNNLDAKEIIIKLLDLIEATVGMPTPKDDLLLKPNIKKIINCI